MAKKKEQKPLSEGRGKVGETYRSGKYKSKTTNLTKKQVASGTRVGKAGKATISKQEAKKALKPIDIRETSWKSASERTGPKAKGGIVVGKDGKPITGTVTLASGKKATYVRGKRVQTAAKKTTNKKPPGPPPPPPPKEREKPQLGGGDTSVAAQTPRTNKQAYKPSKKINRSRKPKLGGSGKPFREGYFYPRRSPLM